MRIASLILSVHRWKVERILLFFGSCHSILLSIFSFAFHFSSFFFVCFFCSFFAFSHFFTFQLFFQFFCFARRPLGRTLPERLRDEPTAPSRDLRLVTPPVNLCRPYPGQCGSAGTMLDSSHTQRFRAQARNGEATATTSTRPRTDHKSARGDLGAQPTPIPTVSQPTFSTYAAWAQHRIGRGSCATLCSRSTLEKHVKEREREHTPTSSCLTCWSHTRLAGFIMGDEAGTLANLKDRSSEDVRRQF